jgi:pseudolysin
MQKFRGKLPVWRLALVALPAAFISVAHAAVPVDLSKQNLAGFKALFANNQTRLEETSRLVDTNHTLHVRVQQTYMGYPVYAADGVVHIPNGANTSTASSSLVAAIKPNTFMNGQVFAGLQADLANTPAYVFTKEQAEKAIVAAIEAYQVQTGSKVQARLPSAELFVYVDDKNKAHWAYRVTFAAPAVNAHSIPKQPVFLLDALNMTTYQSWDDIKTIVPNYLSSAIAGGFGGNKKMGKHVYDGEQGHFPVLQVMRDNAKKQCYLQNKMVKVKNCTSSDDWYGCDKSVDFKVLCNKKDSAHGNVYWNGDIDAVNGGYSPANDALFNGQEIHDMYQSWYNVPALVDAKGNPLQLTMVVHLDMDNAYWSDAEKSMNFGDGVSTFYPLTSLGVTAHEISHGFTSQYSKLEYRGESGGMNEAFSDMAAQAAEFYAYHDQEGWKNNWQIGPEIFKDDEALRYMDMPSKDCGKGRKPGRRCSIDSADQMTDSIDVHYSSGVYNRAYYLIATAPGYDAKKAFDVMVKANMHYWTKNATFASGACGVLQAATDLGYPTQPIYDAFATVKVDTTQCEVKKIA